MSCERGAFYFCKTADGAKCDCMAEIVKDCANDCELVCCGSPMQKVVYKTADQGKEKHVPVVEKVPGGFKVKIGEVPHPMEEKHYIEFIEIRAGNEIQRKYLKPGTPAEAVFKTDAASINAIESCNIHGVWIK